ncbi:MAG: slipin family protein, partial [Cyanobacteria bacterium J06639_18]
MWKTFYIKPNEIGILYHRSDFKKILTAGTYTYFGRHWRVEKFDLNNPEAKIENLELLLRDNTAELQEYLLIVRTNFNETALVRMGQQWINILPNQLRAFWRDFIEVESHIFNLEENLELPTQFVQQLRGFNFSVLTKIFVNEYQIGLLYVQNDFVRPLKPGEYAFWTAHKGVTHYLMSRLDRNPNFPLEEVLIDKHPEFVANYCAIVETTAQQIVIIRYQGKVISILPPTSRKLFWQDVDIEIIDISKPICWEGTWQTCKALLLKFTVSGKP